MWSCFVWLIYGSNVLLTPTATAVTQQCVLITPKKPMLVKGNGAALVIELPFSPSDHWPEGIISRLN